MSEQAMTTDKNPYRPSGSSGAVFPDRPLGPIPVDDDRHDRGGEAPMVQDAAAAGPAGAALVGSLQIFSLSDVLTLLASTGQTGQLEVAAEGVEGRLWLDGGLLSDAQVGATTTVVQAVFELACAVDGWFSYSTGSIHSGAQPAVPVEVVLDEVRPQVEEWREIRDVIPLESVVALSPTPPGKDVQIRGDQWQVLAAVGTNGLSVREVLEQTGGEQIVGLRTLRDLHVAGLIVLLEPEERDTAWSGPVAVVPDFDPVTALPTPPFGSHQEEDAIHTDGVPPPPSSAEPATASPEERQDGLAEVAIMPPPIAGDPWTPVTEPHDSGIA